MQAGKPSEHSIDKVIWIMTEARRILESMEMETEAGLLRQRIDEWKGKQTQIVFVGAFNSGKSTLINALLRKCIVRTSGIPETAVITKISHGSSEKTRIYYKDLDRKPLYLEKQEYFGQIRISQEDMDKFGDIAYALLEDESVGQGFTFIDTPGLECMGEDDQASLEMLARADIIVYVVNALRMVDAKEREIICRFFSMREKGCVFFVINRINEVNGDLEEISERLKQELCEVFSDLDGMFSEKMFERRVFYVDALRSECARTGKELITRRGIKAFRERIDRSEDAMTGVPCFEDELMRECRAGYVWKYGVKRFLDTLNRICDAADKKKDQYLQKEDLAIEELEREVANLEMEILAARQTAQEIEGECKIAVGQILMEAGKLYNEFLYETENEWDEYFGQIKLDFDFFDEIGVAWLKIKNSLEDFFANSPSDLTQTQIKELRDSEFRQKLVPITREINHYIEQKAKRMAEKTALAARDVLHELMGTVSDRLNTVDQVMTEKDFSEMILDNCCENYNIDVKMIHGNVNGSQVAAGLLLFGNSYLAFDSMFQNMSWSDFISDAIYRHIYASVVSMMIGTITGSYVTFFILKGLYTIFRRQEAAKAAGENIVLSARKECLCALRDSWPSVEKKLEEQLSEQLIARELWEKLYERIADWQKLLDATLLKKHGVEVDRQTYVVKMETACSRLRSCVDEIIKTVKE